MERARPANSGRDGALHQEQKATAAAEAQRANAAGAETRQNLYASDMLLAQHALDDGNTMGGATTYRFSNGQGYTASTFDADLGGWDPGEPLLSVGQAMATFKSASVNQRRSSFSSSRRSCL